MAPATDPLPGSPRTADPGPGDRLSLVHRLLDAAPTAVVGVQIDGTIDYANASAAMLFGYRTKQLIGCAAEVLVPTLTDPLARTHGEYLADKQPGSTNTALATTARRRDGTDFPVEITLTALPIGKGAPWVVVGISDISARRAAEDRADAASRAYLTLAQINQAIVRAPDAATLFADTCRIAVEQGGYLGAWVGERGPGSSVRSIASAGDSGRYLAQLEISVDPAHPRGSGPTASALTERGAYFSSGSPDDSATPWHASAAAHGIRALAALPLRCEGQTVAVLTLYSAQADAFNPQMRSLLKQVAGNVSFALDSFTAEDRLRQVAAQRSELLGRLVNAQESERVRIAADVHDESVQVLAAVALRLGLLQRRLLAVAPVLEPSVVEIQSAVGIAISGLRQLLFDLEPVNGTAGCAVAVREAAEHIFEDHTVAITLHCDEDMSLPDVEQTQALRIVKEALINVRKHAQATRVDIALKNRDDGVEVAITDNGVGLDPRHVPRQLGHRGLQTMRDRAEAAGGWWRLESGEPVGTIVRFWLPHQGRAATTTQT